MTRPRLLDLFCGAGGAAMGYHLAGFDVVGVDIRPQPRFPFAFHQADALTFPLDGFDVIHASPPCQHYSPLAKRWPARVYPDLIAPIRERLVAAGVPYVIENVPGAPLRDPVLLCGTWFGLGTKEKELRRHRLFEIRDGSWFHFSTPCQHRLPALGVYGHTGGQERRRPGATPRSTIAERRQAMGIDWMNRDELSEAIPPAYSHFIARALDAANYLEVAS